MVHKEKLPTIAASKKRFALPDISPPIKRRALAELPALSNFDHGPKTRSRFQKEEKRRAKPVPDEPSNIANEEDDPQLCLPYAADVLAYLRFLEGEERRRPMRNYMEKVQKKVISANMRGILVDWLVEVAEEYKLLSDTLYLAVSYVDRFLSCNAVDKQKLQLLGVSSVLIASKYEEIEPPKVKDFCYITDNTYTKKELVQMEANILKSLHFEMGNPTAKTFLRNFINAGVENKNSELLANFLAELSLLDYDCIRFLPSLIAASVVFLARFTMNPNVHPWSSKLQQYTGYSSSDLKDCVLALHNMQMNRKFSSLTAIREKYKQPKFKAVSAMIVPSEIPSSCFEDFEEL
ncbi:cyclin-A3-1-like [Phalaenopsis equestris]|uniref:cyclin-A3-1-like n=1 Tax=Phalaenopsis equestris TaxID=78828 RepID=UPI0009E4602B|nr:cyclin-A3-1-like [Phalaenopsis equestris]